MGSYNENMYASVLNYFNVTNVHDRKMIANKLSKEYAKHSCIDNYRICLSDMRKTKSNEYKIALDTGCCGFYDEYLYNEVSGNYYWIGFNHGH